MRWSTLVRSLVLAAAIPYAAAADISWRPEQVYGQAGGADLVLDLALPAPGKGPAPAVVCIHGGGWIGGSRKQFAGFARRLAAAGFVAATIDYRLAPRFPLPAAIEDAKCAVRWLRSNASTLGIDPARIGAVGESAGGHLALMLGTTAASDGLEGFGGNPGVDSRVSAVVSTCGPTDMAPDAWDATGVKAVYHTDVPTVMAILGGPEAASLAKRCSPVAFAGTGDAPVLAFHGDADRVVPVAQARRLCEALAAAGVEEKLVVLPGLGHGLSSEAHKRIEGEAIAFLTAHLTAPPKPPAP